MQQQQKWQQPIQHSIIIQFIFILIAQSCICILFPLPPTFFAAAISNNEVSMGTTILAVRYNGGVVVGADTRTSVGGYVSNRYATKISFVLDHEQFDMFAIPPSSNVQLESSLYRKRHDGDRADKNDGTGGSNNILKLKPALSTCCICRSGSAADSQNLVDKVRHQILSRRILHSTPSTVSNIASLIQGYVRNDPDMHTSLICAGFDHRMGRGVIYSIDLGGSLVEQSEGWTCSGSGSTYILGHIDAHFPKRVIATDDDGNESESSSSSWLWSEEEAVEFVGKAIELAMDRDGSSGGFVRIFVIDRLGKRGVLRMPLKLPTTKSIYPSLQKSTINSSGGNSRSDSSRDDNETGTEWADTIRKSSGSFD